MKLLLAPVVVLLSAAGAAQSRLADLHRMVPFNVEHSFVVLADVDGDGLLEAVQGTDPMRLLRTDGDGRFVQDDGVFPPVRAGALAVADLDGDGNLDVVAHALPDDVVFLGDGDGAFQHVLGALPSFGLGLGLGARFSIGDMDGDGDADIAAADGGQILWNDGTAHFTAGPELADCCQTDVAVVDLDGDDDLDVVLVSTGGFPSRAFANDGSGGFAEIPGAIPAGGTSVVAGDVDADGDPDLVLGPGALLLNDGAGVFTEQPGVIPPIAQGPVVLLVDYDLDLDLDILLASERLSLMLGDGTGGFTHAPHLVPPSRTQRTAAFLAAGDVDDDGDMDVWMGGGGDGTGSGEFSGASDRLFLGDGSGGFVLTERHFPTESTRPVALATGDFDGDGFQDAVVGEQSEPPALWLGDGAGGFVDASERLPNLVSFDTVDCAAGDVDADGDLDLVVLNDRAPHALLLNQGNACFAHGGDVLSGDPLDVDLADMDGNGTLDAVLARFNAPNELWSNDGTGSFSLVPGALGTDPSFTWGVALGDVDGDGLPEVFAANTGTENSFHRNLGGGSFLDATSALPAGSDHGGDAVIRDFDGDGDGDVFLTRFDLGFMSLGEEQNHLYLFEDGAFVDATDRLPDESTSGTAIVAEDFDGDGDVDLLVANSFDFASTTVDLPASYYENDGGAVFTRPPDAIPTALPEALATADFDGDGDLDVFGGRWVWTNVTHQLAWRALPRIGKELVLDLWGEPGDTWVLLGSLGRFQRSLAAGTVWIDPAQVVIRASGALDGAGRAAPSFQVPPDPGLLGIPSYWQVLFASPLRLSNLEIVVLTAG